MSRQIAIDGPVAVGKSTIARLLAQRLGFVYVDTGAMYRATALLCQRYSVDIDDEVAVVKVLDQHTISLETPTQDEQDGRKVTVRLDEEDVSWAIRTEEVSHGASIVATYAPVRAKLVERQQAIAQEQDVVMEGRDITFRVLPNAELKIFLTASDEQRARWRHDELLMRGQDVTFEEVIKELQERDNRDRTRQVDPLHVADDAWEFDRTGLELEEVLGTIEERAHQLWPELRAK